MAVVKNLMVRAGADFSGMRNEMAKANKSMSNFKSGMNNSLKKIAGVFATVFAVRKIVQFGKASYQASNEAAIAEAKLATIMRQRMKATDATIDSVKALADAQEKIGVVDAASQIAGAQELATYLEQAKNLKTLMPVLNDLVAQQYGLEASAGQVVGMATMLGKVMDGQVGALSRYGFTFDTAQEKILKFGNETERAALLAEIVKESLGDMNAELGKTPQGQMKQIAFTMMRVKEELGRGIMPIMQKLLPYIQAMANAFLRAAQFATAFVNAMLGTKKATAKLTGGVGDLADAYDDAGKAAKGSVAGFDEVNNLGSDNTSGTSGLLDSLSDETGTSMFDDLGAAMSDVAVKAKEMSDKVKAAFGTMTDYIRENSDLIIAALAGVGTAFALAFGVAKWGSIVTIVQRVGSVIGAALATISLPVTLIIAAVAALTAGFVYFYKTNESFRGVVEGILNKIGEAAKWLWDSVLVPFGKWLGTVFVAAWDGVKVASMWLWKNILVPLGDFLVWFWKSVITPLGKVLGEVLAVAFDVVAGVAKSFWKNVMVPLGNFFVDIFGPAVEALSAVFSVLWEYVLKPFGAFLGNVLKAAFTDLTNTIVWLWDNVLKPLSTFIGGVFLSVFESVFESIGGIIDGLKTAFIGLMTFITGVFTGDWQKAWNGIKDVFGGIWDAMGAMVKGAINIMIAMVNKLIDGINKISFDIPDWLGGGKFGINIPHIPKLAQGGITNGPMLAVIGDNVGGQEVVSPLDDLLGMITSAMMSVSQTNNQGGDVVLMIDGKEVARAIAPELENEKQRIGTRMILQPT